MAETQDVRTAVAEAFNFADTTTAPVEMAIALNGEAVNLLDRLTLLLDRDRGGAIAEALAFLYMGVSLQKEGMNMAIVDRDGKVQTVLDLLPRR